MSTSQPFQVIVRYAICTFVLALGIRTWLVMGLIHPVVVAGSSMEPTLVPGERLWIDRTTFVWRSPRRGEVVVARNPRDGNQLCIKRIVGLPGEHIVIDSGKLLVDGIAQRQPAAPEVAESVSLTPLPWKSREWQLGSDDYFLLGDNSQVSVDSRLWGPVPSRLLLGKPLGVR